MNSRNCFQFTKYCFTDRIFHLFFHRLLFQIVPPPGWSPVQPNFEDSKEKFSIVLQKMVDEGGNRFLEFPKHKFKQKSLREFKKMAMARQKSFEAKHGNLSPEAIEKVIWSNDISKENIYGSDIELNILDNSNKVLNLNELKDLVREFTQREGEMPGISTPFGYAGSIASIFCWHLEDLNLFSISVNAKGAPKIW